MLHGLAPLAHLLRMFVEPLLNGVEDIFMFPAGNPALLAGGATILDDASPAGRGPIAPQGEALFLIGEVVNQPLVGGTDVDIVARHIPKVLFGKTPFGLAARGLRLRQRDGDIGLVAGQDLLALEVAAIGNHIQPVHPRTVLVFLAMCDS